MERVRTFGGSYGLDALALLFAAISVARLWGAAPRGAAPLLALAATLPLVARRRWPLAAPVLALAALLGLSVLVPGAAWEQLQLFLAALLCFWAIGSDNERRPALAGLLAGLAVASAAVATDRGHRGVGDFVFGVVITTAAWGAGLILGTHARSAAAARRQAERLGFEQELRERAAAEQERARIARELHDVIAHTVSIMVVQAGRPRRYSRARTPPRAPRWPRSGTAERAHSRSSGGCSVSCTRPTPGRPPLRPA